MAAPDPDSREFRQMRHDVDDVYTLLDATKDKLDETRTAVGTVWGVQRRHGNRLEEIQQSLDLQSGRLDRMEDTQRQQGERLGRVDTRLEGVDTRLERVDTRLEGVDTRLGHIEETQQEILTLLRGRSG
jgi:septation ring formation regulator EzrA